MITFSHGGKLIEGKEELPNLYYKRIYLDCETTSGDPKLDSLNPWHNCGIAGLCITGDYDPTSYYVPMEHLDANWLKRTLAYTDEWVNHNIVYDYLVLHNCLGIKYHGKLVDTLTLAKLKNSDLTYQGGYGLTNLSKLWLGEEWTKKIVEYENKVKGYLHNSKDYGEVSADRIAEYGCGDVLTTRKIFKLLELGELAATEIALTKTLVQVSLRGLKVNPKELKIAQLKTFWKRVDILERIRYLTGWLVLPNSGKDCAQLLCNQFGLKPLRISEAGNPSFDKYVLSEYLETDEVRNHPESKRLTLLLELFIEYRKCNTMEGLFWVPWQELHVEGVLHPSFNQSVRSGRMSCKQPNAQQINTEAKLQIVPREGYKFIEIDYSQIEYRVMVHVLEDKPSIAAYAKDPNMDFHQLIADRVGISRQPAKTLNFAIGFGAGRAKVVNMLKNFGSEADAERAYRDYHENLPGLRRVSHELMVKARVHGSIINPYGRRLHLKAEYSHHAFNRIVQSTGADILKSRLTPLFELTESKGCHIICVVHDSVLIEAPLESNYAEEFRDCFCDVGNKFKVPITADIAESAESWGLCKEVSSVSS